jgi:hypothetical protein
MTIHPPRQHRKRCWPGQPETAAGAVAPAVLVLVLVIALVLTTATASSCPASTYGPTLRPLPASCPENRKISGATVPCCLANLVVSNELAQLDRKCLVLNRLQLEMELFTPESGGVGTGGRTGTRVCSPVHFALDETSPAPTIPNRGQESLRHKDVRASLVYGHVLNRAGRGPRPARGPAMAGTLQSAQYGKERSAAQR